jgi:PTH1 family peptidyl-tRNA hydrolase
MKLFVGLGNPGGGYARNRHNVGFMAADRIAARHGFGAWKGKFSGQLAEGHLDGEKCLLLKPTTYMNESGRAVGEAMRFYKLAPSDVTVFYDELDLAPGKIRVKSGGGAAGHKGIRSVTAHIGADFRRVRIGIGHPGSKAKVQGYVLRDFAKADAVWLEPLLDALADAAPKLARGDDSGFMNVVALAVQSGGGETPTAPPARKTQAKGKPGTGTTRPSQRDLARRAAEQKTARTKSQKKKAAQKAPGESETRPAKKPAEAEVGGPFALLRSLFGTSNK